MNRINWKIAAAIILPLMLLAAIRLFALKSGETCLDAYYHAKMADMGPAYFTAGKFPAMTMSVWAEHFSDKELLYHVILSGLRGWQKALGFSTDAPFNFPALFFSSILIASFVYAAHKFNIKNIYIYSLLLICVSPFLTNRLMMLRPHLPGISITLIAASLFYTVREKRRLWIFFICGFIMSWSYSNPHFILLPAFVFAIFRFREEKLFSVLMPLAALCGIAAGQIIHPQFPNTLINWQIQCVNVIMQTLCGKAPVYLASELQPPDKRWLLQNSAFIIFFIFNLFLFLTLLKKRGLDIKSKALFTLSAITFAGTFISVRAAEYSGVFTLLSAGVLVTDAAETQYLNIRPKVKKLIFRLTVFLLLPCCVLFTLNFHFINLSSGTLLPADGVARWLKENKIPEGTLIANICWSDFPPLFYSAPQYKYLMGLDPMYGYAFSREKVSSLERFRTGKIYIKPAELAVICNSRFAYISKLSWQFARHIYDRGYVLIYQDGEGYLFDLTRDNWKTRGHFQ